MGCTTFGDILVRGVAKVAEDGLLHVVLDGVQADDVAAGVGRRERHVDVQPAAGPAPERSAPDCPTSSSDVSPSKADAQMATAPTPDAAQTNMAAGTTSQVRLSLANWLPRKVGAGWII